MQFENIRNLREDSDKTQQELVDYLLGRTTGRTLREQPLCSTKNRQTP